MDTRMDALHSYLKTQNALYRQQAKTLLADDRGDESHFETIRANILKSLIRFFPLVKKPVPGIRIRFGGSFPRNWSKSPSAGLHRTNRPASMAIPKPCRLNESNWKPPVP